MACLFAQVIAVSRSLSILLAVGLLLVGSLATAGGASAANSAGPTTTCSNGVDNTGGLGLICRITVVNTIRGTGGTAKVTIRECHGAAGDPNAACTTTVTNLTKLVTSVNQCNDSINGGGGTLRCSVQVINRFIGRSTGATAATVNECNGSGASGAIGATIVCDPFPATTSGATITQCNGSANGGTLVGLRCSATGTKPSSHGVRINQCNGSANGGGALVICTATISNLRIAVAPTAAPSSGSSGGSNAGPTPPSTDTQAIRDAAPSGVLGIVFAAIFSLAFVATMAGVAGRRSRRAVPNR
jgi:hypothetical protein